MNTLPCFHEIKRLIETVDEELAQQHHQAPCPHCGGKLNCADYPRQPRGGVQNWNSRRSFCCSQEGCRRRLTPPSVRFFGRRLYPALLVVLASAMQHGLNDQRVAFLKDTIQVSRATLSRWRRWWLQTFPTTRFWRGARGDFMPPVALENLPCEIVERFQRTSQGIVNCLRYLSPLSSRSTGLADIYEGGSTVRRS